MIATTSPTTTGGKAIPVLMMLKMKDRPEKFPSASNVPNGKPISRLSAVAIVETCSDNTVILKISVMGESIQVHKKTRVYLFTCFASTGPSPHRSCRHRERTMVDHILLRRIHQ